MGRLDAKIRQKEIYISGRCNGKQGNINGVIEQKRDSGRKSPKIPESPKGKVMSAACNRVCCCKLCVGKSDHNIDNACCCKRKACCALCRCYDKPEGRIDISSDISVSPHVGAPYGNVPSEFVWKFRRWRCTGIVADHNV